MPESPVETLFQVLDETSQILQKEMDITYLEALAETGENIFQDQIGQKDVSDVARKRLAKYYAEINRLSYTSEDIRKAFQLACLKGMRKTTQPNHQLTPDSIGIFVSYLIQKFFRTTQRNFSILDPAVGTGNLLTTILNQLNCPDIRSYGVEIDDLLIRLAYVNANLQNHPLELYRQDSLRPLFVEPVDCVVCDLPVGYYPGDASEFELKADEGHSYAHHLFIEQSTRYTKDGGYLFFLVPNTLFTSPEAEKLREFVKSHHHIQAFISLPESMFKNKEIAKSLFVLQKQGAGVKPPKEILMAILPSMTDMRAMENMLERIDQWFKENKYSLNDR